MRKYTTGLAAGLALLAGVGLVALQAADDKPLHAATKKLAAEAGTKDWAALSKAGAPIAKKYMTDEIMYQFKPRNAKKNPGIGVGSKPGAVTPDGIEQKLSNMGKRVTVKDVKDAKALKEMADVSAAIAAIIVNQPPAASGAKKPATWKKYSEEMYKAARDLNKALDGKKPADIKKAAIKLNSSCTDCHSVFRDS